MITLIIEPQDYSPDALALYRSLGQVYLWPEVTVKRRSEILRAANMLVVRLGRRIDKKWLEAMPNLKVIVTPTTGLNHIDVGCASKQGVKVISLRGQVGFLRKITSTAELALGLMLSLVRHVPVSFESVKQGHWDRMRFRGHQLSGKTLGIVGYGRLGRIVARYGKVLDMRVIAHDPFVKSARGVELISLEKLLKTSDVVSLHALLTDKNREFIKLKHFKLMKPTAYFINTARAELIEKNALYKALSQRKIAGAAIDVMDDESADGAHLKNDPLRKYARTHSNLIIVPHLGGATFEAMHITEEFIACEVKKYVMSRKL